jgi:DNA-binding MarR family transcriptional regulator
VLDRHAVMNDVLLHFRTVVRAIRRHYQQVEASCGISGAQLWALVHVHQSPGMRVGELARMLAIPQSTASNMLDTLEAAGLVARKRNDEDQRVVRLFATARGRRVLASAPRPLRGVLQQGLLDLPDRSLDSLNRELATLVRCMHLRERVARSTLLEEELRLPGD